MEFAQHHHSGKTALKQILQDAQVPVVDLFAGPGGLCEGFSAIRNPDGSRRFAVKISIEKDPVAHRTLMLRALFRKFSAGRVPDSYYDYVQGKLVRDEFLALPEIRDAADQAAQEARCAELGVTSTDIVDGWIGDALRGCRNWVLIGGPPCQAYSLAGRSRLRSVDPKAFENDERHLLYTEYLRIIRKFSPTVFVMENVKGILNSRHRGSRIFDRILADLSDPGNGLHYQIRSFVVDGTQLEPNDFVIKADEYGIPQRRHRVILFGIRSDAAVATKPLMQNPRRFLLTRIENPVDVETALSGLPRLRSRLSREADSPEAWLRVMSMAPSGLKSWHVPIRTKIEALMSSALRDAAALRSHGAGFIPCDVSPDTAMPQELQSWYLDSRLGGVLQHEARQHMRLDLHRYLFAACFAKDRKYSPDLTRFPPNLLPHHLNLADAEVPFKDRFRVQVAGEPSSTIVAHIKKDGHYYIHHDPAQCRSLTVREAARLQTFPDNYFFEGNRTEQYGQVGNAVPPLLASRIAAVVSDFLNASCSPEIGFKVPGGQQSGQMELHL